MISSVVDTPAGRLLLRANPDGLLSSTFLDLPDVAVPIQAVEHLTGSRSAGAHLRAAERHVERYFAGIADDSKVPLAVSGTVFQLLVWRQLQLIPRGAVRSYNEIAAAAGKLGAARAVGTACGKNPLCLFVPCHRVVAHDQKLGRKKLGGFSAGLWRKELFLRIEGVELN